MSMYQIEGARPLRGAVPISGSKNGSLPLITAALLTKEQSVIENVPDLTDVRAMINMIRHLGAQATLERGVLSIDPSGFSIDAVPYEIMSKMRASFYAMGPLLARLGRARVSIPGGCAIGDRPVDIHLRGFQELGVWLSERQGYIHAKHDGLSGANLSLLGPNGSSVGATCNMMMVAVFAKGLTVIDDAAREPEVMELGRFLNSMGARVEGLGTSRLRIEGVSELHGTHWEVGPDRIEAATYAIAGLITHGDILLDGLRRSDMTPSMMALEQWGAELSWQDERSLRVTRAKTRKRPMQIVTEPFPGFPTDAQPQMTALLALTPGESSIRDTIYPDRFMHIGEFKRLGAKIQRAGKGRIEIQGVGALEGAAVKADDLRAGAALVVAGLAAHGLTQVREIGHIERGYEAVVEKLRGLGAKIERIDENAPAPGLEDHPANGAENNHSDGNGSGRAQVFDSKALEDTELPKKKEG